MVNDYNPFPNIEIDPTKTIDPDFVHPQIDVPNTDSPPCLLKHLQDLTLPPTTHNSSPFGFPFPPETTPQLAPPLSLPSSLVSSPIESGVPTPLSHTPNTPNDTQNGVTGQAPPDNNQSESMPGNSADLSHDLVEKLQNLAAFIPDMNKHMDEGGEQAYKNSIETQLEKKGWKLSNLGRVDKNRLRANASRCRQDTKQAIQKKGINDIQSNIMEVLSCAVRIVSKRKQRSVRRSLPVRPTKPDRDLRSTAEATEISSAERVSPVVFTADIDSMMALNEQTTPPIGQVFIVSSRSQSFDKQWTGDLLSVTTSTGAVDSNDNEHEHSAWIYGQSSYDDIVNCYENANMDCSIFNFTMNGE